MTEAQLMSNVTILPRSSSPSDRGAVRRAGMRVHASLQELWLRFSPRWRSVSPRKGGCRQAAELAHMSQRAVDESDLSPVQTG